MPTNVLFTPELGRHSVLESSLVFILCSLLRHLMGVLYKQPEYSISTPVFAEAVWEPV